MRNLLTVSAAVALMALSAIPANAGEPVTLAPAKHVLGPITRTLHGCGGICGVAMPLGVFGAMLVYANDKTGALAAGGPDENMQAFAAAQPQSTPAYALVNEPVRPTFAKGSYAFGWANDAQSQALAYAGK